MMRTDGTEIATNIGTLVLVISAIVGFAIKQTSFRDKANAKIFNVEEKCLSHGLEIIALREKVNNINVDIAVISKDIKNIFDVLIEIKSSLKNK